jgi:alkanesulfonate monooxygenase SsuD/methylene tetrahydromethanopterin reductase-like flavin-dependent oxidoreductase (luciferase family)
MNIGAFHVSPNSAADPAVIAKHAEALGFESYWVADHTILPVTYSAPYVGGAGPMARSHTTYGRFLTR